jgi:DNA end-binding protein Ku
MTTMNFGDEVQPIDELRELGDFDMQVGERELDVARRLVQSLAEPFDISRYRDTYREAVLELIDRKASGEEVDVQPKTQRRPTATPDLIGALQASLEQVGERSGGEEREPVGAVTGV